MPPTGGDAFRFSDPNQAETHRRLGRLGPGPASFFKDACRLMASRSMETTAHLVGHCLREIDSALREVLEVVVPKVTGTEDNHRAHIQEILRILEIDEDDPVAKAWLSIAGRQEYGLARVAHRDSLRAPRRVDADFLRFWESAQVVLDAITSRIEARMRVWFTRVDELKASEPTAANVSILRNKIPNNIVTLTYFFDGLEHAGWLKPLDEELFFKELPAAIHDEQAGTVAYPPWPQAIYLKVAAEQSPGLATEVADIVSRIPPSDNERAHAQLVEVIAAMPIAVAAKLVPAVKGWLDRPRLTWLPDKVQDLIGRLATGGETAAALALAESLLDVRKPEVTA